MLSKLTKRTLLGLVVGFEIVGIDVVGEADGKKPGLVEGDRNGGLLGLLDGEPDGDLFGLADGDVPLLGFPDGEADREELGLIEGETEGNVVELIDGVVLGLAKGNVLGLKVENWTPFNCQI